MTERLTARLRCRAPGAADAAGYEALLLDPEVGAWLRPTPLQPFSRAEIAALLDRDAEHWRANGFGPLALLDRRTGAFLGRGGLALTVVAGEFAVELPWALVPAVWGAGLATEAARDAVAWARELELPEVVSFTLPGNVASRRVMEKAGLAFAGEIEHAGLPHVLYRLALGGLT